MKKILRPLLTLLLIFSMLVALPVSASAASTETQDGLEVTITADKTEYTADEDIQVSVNIKNNNSYKVENVSIETLLPEGLVLKSGNLSASGIDIESGASYSTSVVAQLSEELKDDDTEPEATPEPEGTPAPEGTPKPESTAKPGDDQEAEPAETGDKINIGLWLVLLTASVIGIILTLKYKKTAKLMSLFLCFAMVLTIMPINVITAENSTAAVTVDITIVVDGKEYIIKSTIQYAKPEDIEDDGKVYTRSEWIGLLADKLNMDLSVDKDSIDFYYADVQDDINAIAIETAHAYGLLPPPDVEDIEQDIPKFYPDAVADREFVAYTAVKAKGFEDHSFDTSTWADRDSITYINEAAIAIEFNFLKLIGNKFEPFGPITTSDINRIFAAFDAIDNSTVVTEENAHDHSVYQSGVLKEILESVEDYTVEQSGDVYIVTLPLNENTSTIVSGSIIVLPGNTNYPAGFTFKVQSVSENEPFIILTCIIPELSEVFEHIDIAGIGTPILNGLVPADGVTCEYDPNGSIDNDDEIYPLHIDLGGSTKVPGTLKFSFYEKKFSDDLKASGSVEVEIPEVTCILDANIGLFNTSVNEFTISIKEKIKLKGELKYTLAESGYELTNSTGNTRWAKGRIELGRWPIAIGATGLSFDIVLFYNVEAKGTASITYIIDSKQGYQYRNGTGRVIFDYKDRLDLLELKGSAKAGLGIAGDLNALNMFDLIGYSCELGVGFNASFTPHVLATDTLYCADVTVYAYATSGLDEETVVGLFLDKVYNYTLEFEHLRNDENNPFKLKLHLENGRRVQECTLGTGGIYGYVFKEGTREALKNARVKIYSGGILGTNLVRTLYTDANGKFSVNNLHDGEYRVMISATGFFTYDCWIKVKSSDDTYLEAFLMVDRSSAKDTVNVSGSIKDAITGYGLTDTSYAVRKGWNNIFGEIIYSGIFPYDSYIIQLPSGNYTLEVKKDGYITNYINIAVGVSDLTNENIVLSPLGSGEIGGEHGFRVVLTWGEKPEDLDSHLYGPAAEGLFHIAFYNESYNDGYYIIADLDVDDTDSYGPETTTVYNLRYDGIYSFLVHDYTNRYEDNSMEMSLSGAKVQVYVGDVLKYTFNIPINNVGTVWHVFDYNASTDELVVINRFWNESDPYKVLQYNE